MNRQVVRSRAPLRLGLAGGGSDVSPYSDRYGGFVLNAAINMYANCTVETLDDGKVEFVAADMNEMCSSRVVSSFRLEAPLMLHKAVYNRVVRDYRNGQPLSIRVTTYSDVPPGSGLGSSSTIVVAMLKSYQELLKLPLGEYDLARLAYEIERQDCGLIGGKQDQYAATFGGFNFMEFYADDRVVVNPLRIRREIVNEIECGMLLYYTGQSRESASIIEHQIKSVESGACKSIEATHMVKQAAVKMKEALLRADIACMAGILGDSWKSKMRMASTITNPRIENFYTSAIEAGAISAKISGAGGGGFMMLFVEPTKRVSVERALAPLGGSFYRFHFVKEGAQAWMV